jgi:hypothetical protein
MREFDEGGILYAPLGPASAVFIDGRGAQLVTRDSREPELILTAAYAASLLSNFDEES